MECFIGTWQKVVAERGSWLLSCAVWRLVIQRVLKVNSSFLMQLSSKVYREAQFYQIEGLIDTLERFSNVFAHKLEEARKYKLGSDFEKWQQQIITCAQNKSLQNLTSTSKVSLLSQEDHKKIMGCGDCVGPHAHNLIVCKPAKRGSVQIHDTFENVQRRVKETEPVVCPLWLLWIWPWLIW